MEIEPLDARQAREFLDAARRDRYEALYVLCLLCGLRQGEALAIRWSDIDLDAGSLYVVRQVQRVRRDGDVSGTLEFSEPKNASRRKVGLPQRAVDRVKTPNRVFCTVASSAVLSKKKASCFGPV